MIGIEWQNPVFDRTAEDIATAYQHISDRKSGKEKIPLDLKGCLNASSMNRIENDLLILAKTVGIEIIAKEWADNFVNQPTTTDKSRILSNAGLIRTEIIEQYELDIPDLPADLMTYNDFNQLEECIDLMSDIIFHPLRTTSNLRLVIADADTPLTVDVYETSATNLNGCLLTPEKIYESIEHDAETHYIVVGDNEVKEYIGDTMIGRRESNA